MQLYRGPRPMPYNTGEPKNKKAAHIDVTLQFLCPIRGIDTVGRKSRQLSNHDQRQRDLFDFMKLVFL